MSVERIGVSSVEKIINQMGMIFREQPVDDYGIDAQIEIVENKCATGKLIAVQIKSGNSYFKELSLPKPNVVNDQNLTAYTVFEDVDSPKGFRIFVKDKNGNRAAGTVDWAAYGV